VYFKHFVVHSYTPPTVQNLPQNFILWTVTKILTPRAMARNESTGGPESVMEARAMARSESTGGPESVLEARAIPRSEGMGGP
jgi:hypothetical protein